MQQRPEAFFKHAIYVKGKIQYFILLLLMLVLSPSVSAQTDSENLTIISNNTPAADSAYHPSEEIIPQLKQNLSRHPLHYIYIFSGCFILLVIIRLVTPSYLKELLLSLLNLKLLLGMYKEGRFDWNVNNFLLDVISVLMFALFIQQGIFPHRPGIFLWVLAFTGVAYFFKLILIQFLANIFFGRGEALVHLLLHTMFTRIAGLILLPVLFAAFYQTRLELPQLLVILCYILISVYAIWLVRLYVKMKSVSTGGLIYLFLYLCTIELSPLLILYKEVTH